MLLDIAWKSLWQSRWRTILTVIGVGATIQLYVTMNCFMGAYEKDLQRQLSAFSGKVFVQQALDSAGNGTDFPSTGSSIKNSVAAALLETPQIDPANSSALLFISLQPALAPNSPPEVMVVGVEPGHESAYFGGFRVEAGSSRLGDPYSVLLGHNEALSQQTDGTDNPLQPGDTLEIAGHTFTVAGVLEQGTPLLFSNSMIIPLETAQSLFKTPNAVSSVVLTAQRGVEADQIKAGAAGQYPNLQFSTSADLAKNADEILIGQRAFFRLIDESVVAVAVVAITIIMVVFVMEHRREIGTLRAVGGGVARVIAMVAGEGVIISLTGALLALPFSTAFIEIGWMNIATNSYSVAFSDVLSVWITSLLIAVPIGILASLIPAVQAARVDPLEALRYE